MHIEPTRFIENFDKVYYIVYLSPVHSTSTAREVIMACDLKLLTMKHYKLDSKNLNLITLVRRRSQSAKISKKEIQVTGVLIQSPANQTLPISNT